MSAEENHLQYSVVVPLFNEQESVPHLYVKITDAMDAIGGSYEIVFVDDGSKDATFRRLSEICRDDHRVVAVRLRRNFGQTAALKAGFDHACGDIIISMDGDLQHDPAEIPRFIEKMQEGYDIVSGWRVQRTDHWLMRQLPSRIANRMMAKLSRVDLHDFGTTFKAYRREIVSEINLYGELHRFIPALASFYGARIAEVPIRNIPRSSGGSHYGLGRTFRVMFDIFTIWFLLKYFTRPMHFFGKWGLTSGVIGGAVLTGLAAEKIWTRIDIIQEHGPLMLVGALALVTGVILFCTGLLGEVLTRTYFESQGRRIYAVREIRTRREEKAAGGAR
jgi:glycosyltransferase involved in cell wall biosynthesis